MGLGPVGGLVVLGSGSVGIGPVGLGLVWFVPMWPGPMQLGLAWSQPAWSRPMLTRYVRVVWSVRPRLV